MDNQFHFDPTRYQEQVANIAEHVVFNDDAILTFAPRVEFEPNSYHETAIREAERARLSKLYPRLYL